MRKSLEHKRSNAPRVTLEHRYSSSSHSRAMVIGMAGPTDLVGHSIGLRWGLIVFRFSSIVG